MFKAAIESPESYGPKAHHAANALIEVERLEAALKATPGPQRKRFNEAINWAIDLGRHLALLEVDDTPLVFATDEEKQEIVRSMNANDRRAEPLLKRNKKNELQIDPAEYDRLRNQKCTLEQIAERFRTSRPTLDNWRKRNGRM